MNASHVVERWRDADEQYTLKNPLISKNINREKPVIARVFAIIFCGRTDPCGRALDWQSRGLQTFETVIQTTKHIDRTILLSIK